MITVRVSGFWKEVPIPEEYCINYGPCNLEDQDYVEYDLPINVIAYYLTILEVGGFRFTISGGN